MKTTRTPGPLHFELATLVASEHAARRANEQTKANRIHRRIEAFCRMLEG